MFAIQHQVQNLVLVIKRDPVLDALLIQSLQDHVSGAVGRITGPAHGRLTEITGVSPEPALIDATVRGAVEGEPPVFKIIDRLHRFFGHEHGRLLVHQVITPLDRVKSVPSGFVFFHVAKRRTDAPLGCPRVAADRVHFGKDSGFCLAAHFECCVETGAARAYNDGVKCVFQRNLL